VDKSTKLLKDMLSTGILMHLLANDGADPHESAAELGELMFTLITDVLGEADKELKRLEKENKALRVLISR
jgi:hypothetical protein